MQFRAMVLYSTLIAAISALTIVAPASRAAACSCALPTVESSYTHASDVAFVDLRRTYVSGDTRYYLGRVVRTFKGCLHAGQRVLLKTPEASASCGAELRLRRYLINGTSAGSLLGTPTLSISLCNYDRQLSVLTAGDLRYLERRTVCCDGVCSCADGSQPVQCFADPCSGAPACDQGECIANYCGGCHAEYYDSLGHAVCEDPSECKTDADCPQGSWCRQAQSSDTEPVYECAPFVGEEARCEGFTLPWLYERCEPGLTCDAPDGVEDATGICRKHCESNRDCKEQSYCASDKLCDDDGACEQQIDCNLVGNLYGHIECVGHGICIEQRCNWRCGQSGCADNTCGLDASVR
jgi:hypothetical protein